MSKYLVTGGAGFIGSHIVEKLVKLGEKVRVLDNFSSGEKENLKSCLDKIELINADIRDIRAVKKGVSGVDFILHQAALCSVPQSLINPYEYNTVNIEGTLNLLNCANEYKVKRFIFASSCSIYGNADTFPIKESLPLKLFSPYALTKLAAEFYCRIYNENYGLETVCLRYFNVFGPRQRLEDDYSAVIPKFVACLLKDKPCPIYGDGTQTRDFVYIDNVVEANILAALAPNIKCEVVNIAGAKEISILTLVDKLNELTKKTIKPSFTLPRKGDILRTLADISKAKKILKYEPRISFDEGLERTVEWFRKNKQP